ncbi:MAG: hypothetical protein WC449_05125 [Candidatus Paceibacterota bacterium]
MTVQQEEILESIKKQLRAGEITTEEANVQIVRLERIRIVTKLSKEIRTYLNNAVKAGRLGHLKKDSALSEIYYHPNFKYLALEAREKELYRLRDALKKTCAA